MNNRWSSTHSIQPSQLNQGIDACQNNKHNKPQTKKTSKFKTVSYPGKNSSERQCSGGRLHHIGGQPIHKDKSNEELNIWRTFVIIRQQLRMRNRLQGPNCEAPYLWKMNFLFKKCNLQGNEAFRFQYTRTFSTSPRCRKKGHEEEVPSACRTYSCLAMEYSKELQVQQFKAGSKFRKNLPVGGELVIPQEKSPPAVSMILGTILRDSFVGIKQSL